MSRYVITGLGLICATGNDVETCWKNVRDGVSGIREVTSVSTEGCVSHVGAEVRCDDLPAPEYDRSVRLCLHAAQEALRDSALPESDLHDAGVILGSCVGGAASIDHYYTGLLQGEERKQDVLKMSASAIACDVAHALGASGETANIVNACAAGTMSIAFACDLIRAGKGKVYLAGGTDAFSSLAYSGFNALHALSADACSPLNHSNGITLGEGSGILVVEEYEHAVARGAKIYCEIAGYGVSSDAFHITAPQPEGEGQMAALRRTMVNGNVKPEEIGYINTHGTGTKKNDAAEFLSLHSLFDGCTPSVSSTKSMTGHCLGAAGAIEAVLSVKALTENTVLPTTNYAPEDLPALAEKAGNLDCVVNVGREKQMENAMSNSFAFGGTNASIIFTKNEHDAPLPVKSRIAVTGFGKLAGNAVELTAEGFDARGVKLGFYRKLDRFSQMQVLSGVDALRDAGFEINAENAPMVGSVIGTADGPMAEISNFQKTVCEKGPAAGSAFSFPNTVYNAAGGHLSIFTGLKGYCATIANGTQAGLQAVTVACDMLQNGTADLILASGTDETSENIQALYNSIGKGENLGEGSVTAVLETEAHAKARGARVYADILGYASLHEPTAYGAETTKRLLDRTLRAACADAGVAEDKLGKIFYAGTDASQDVTQEIGNSRAAAAAYALQKAAEALERGDCQYAAAVAGSWTGCVSAVVLGRANA